MVKIAKNTGGGSKRKPVKLNTKNSSGKRKKRRRPEGSEGKTPIKLKVIEPEPEEILELTPVAEEEVFVEEAVYEEEVFVEESVEEIPLEEAVLEEEAVEEIPLEEAVLEEDAVEEISIEEAIEETLEDDEEVPVGTAAKTAVVGDDTDYGIDIDVAPLSPAESYALQLRVKQMEKERSKWMTEKVTLSQWAADAINEKEEREQTIDEIKRDVEEMRSRFESSIQEKELLSAQLNDLTDIQAQYEAITLEKELLEVQLANRADIQIKLDDLTQEKELQDTQLKELSDANAQNQEIISCLNDHMMIANTMIELMEPLHRYVDLVDKLIETLPKDELKKFNESKDGEFYKNITLRIRKIEFVD